MSEFPSKPSQALALLFLQSKNLNGYTPKQLVKRYQDVEAEIAKELKEDSSQDSVVGHIDY